MRARFWGSRRLTGVAGTGHRPDGRQHIVRGGAPSTTGAWLSSIGHRTPGAGHPRRGRRRGRHRHPAEPSAPRSPRRARVLRAALGSHPAELHIWGPPSPTRSPLRPDSRSTSRRRCSPCGSPRRRHLELSHDAPYEPWMPRLGDDHRTGRSSTGARPWATGSRTAGGASPISPTTSLRCPSTSSKVEPEWVSGIEVASGGRRPDRTTASTRRRSTQSGARFGSLQHPSRRGFRPTRSSAPPAPPVPSPIRIIPDDELEALCERVRELWEGWGGRPRPRRRGDRLRRGVSGGPPDVTGSPRTMVLPMEAAFFDLDKTVISRSSTLALSRPPCTGAGMVSRGQLLRGAYAQLVYLLVGSRRGEDGAPEGRDAPAHEGLGSARRWSGSSRT